MCKTDPFFSESKLVDFHAHTNLSYCADDNLRPHCYAKAIKRIPYLEEVVLTDHGMAIYFPEKTAWTWEFISDSSIFDQFRDYGNHRLEDHLAELSKWSDQGIRSGIEVEMMNDGRLTIDPAFRDSLDIVIGSVHFLPVSMQTTSDDLCVLRYWRDHVSKLLDSGIDILGHPFRWLANQFPVTKEVVRDIVKRAKEANVAVELNSHYHIPSDADMLRAAIEFDVPVAFATDAHSIEEIGDFFYHKCALMEAGLKLSDLRMFSSPCRSSDSLH